MSFDLAVLSGQKRLIPADAGQIYVQLCEEPDTWSDLLEADDRVAAFVDEITARWPQIDDVPEDEVDDCPWNIEFDQSPAHAISCIAWSRAEEVAPVYLEIALRHGLYVYNPQEDKLFAPTRRLELRVAWPPPSSSTTPRTGRWRSNRRLASRSADLVGFALRLRGKVIGVAARSPSTSPPQGSADAAARDAAALIHGCLPGDRRPSTRACSIAASILCLRTLRHPSTRAGRARATGCGARADCRILEIEPV